MHEQIISLFTNPLRAMHGGLWYSGIYGNGEFKQWYESGKMLEHSFWKNRKKEGEYKRWYNDGQIYEHAFYKNDKLNGEYKVWNRNGNLATSQTFKDDKEI